MSKICQTNDKKDTKLNARNKAIRRLSVWRTPPRDDLIQFDLIYQNARKDKLWIGGVVIPKDVRGSADWQSRDIYFRSISQSFAKESQTRKHKPETQGMFTNSMEINNMAKFKNIILFKKNRFWEMCFFLNMHLWTVISTVSWTAEWLCVLSVSSDELSHTCLKPSLISFTESPLTALLATVRSWIWAQAWLREWEREGETCPCSSLVSYSMACMHVVAVVLLLCVWMHIDLQHLSVIFSFSRGRRYDRTSYFLHRAKHLHRNDLTLSQNL